MAKNDQRRALVIQLLQMLRNRAHGDEAGSLDPANRVLFRFAYIDQSNRHGTVYEILYLKGLYFDRRLV